MSGRIEHQRGGHGPSVSALTYPPHRRTVPLSTVRSVGSTADDPVSAYLPAVVHAHPVEQPRLFQSRMPRRLSDRARLLVRMVNGSRRSVE